MQPKTKQVTETRDVVYETKLKNPDMKIENESNKFLHLDPDVDVMLEAGMEKESVSLKKISPDSSDASWHAVKTSDCIS